MRGPVLRLARAQWAPLAALAALTAVSALLAVVLPARIAAGYDRAAASAVGAGADVRVEGRSGGETGARTIPGMAAMTSNSVAWQDLLPPSLRGAVGEPEPSMTSGRMSVAGEAPSPRLLYLGWAEGALERVRLVAGGPPVNRPSGTGDEDAEIQVVVAQEYADAMGYAPGDRLVLNERDVPRPVRVRISGVYEPVDAADPYWGPRPTMLRAMKAGIGDGVLADVGTALMDAGGYTMLTRHQDRRLTYSWRFPVRRGAVDSAGAAAMADDLDAYRSAVRGRSDLFPCEVVTPLDGRLRGYADRLHTAKSVVGPALGGLAAVAAGVLLLAAGLLGVRLRPVLGTMRARGAALRQLAVPACGLTALAVVPSAALGYAVGRLLDAGPPQAASVYAIAVSVLAVLAVSAATVARERGGGLESSAGRRDDIAAARPSRRRLVLDVLLVALAVIGVVLLRRRGAAAGTDPLVAAVPVLLGAALGVLVLRAYPYLLRAAGPYLRRRRGAVAFLGLARAGRQGLAGTLPLAVLLIATAVAGFTATVGTALRDGQERASWAEVGADARVPAGPLDDAALRRIRAVRGVTGAVPARVVTNVTAEGDRVPVTVIGVDLDAYREIAPGTPGVPDASGVWFSRSASRLLGSGTVTLSRPGLDPLRVTPAGRIDRFPGLDPGSAFAVVPYELLAEAKGFPAEVFVAGESLDAEALRAAVPGRDVRLRQDVLDGMAGVPLVSVVHGTFRDAALAGGAYGFLAVLLVLVVGARERGRTVARLRALGLSRRQCRALALAEIAPVLLCAVGAGWALGLLLPRIIGPAADLRPYTGGFAAAAQLPGVPALLGLAAALLLAAAAAVAVDRAADSRPGTALRTGDP
ncbi:FtsX-like permease family protein [Actinomadura sp. 6K520]|uniref:FtsX-like permease family protein n=1 Tax=Actinomadura sp. 6K520 TaxID=2530364 RepID=UPI00104C5797|nr:FtsX-like permease family protein [Actinomadura sp. 6K520]TDE18823.1 ABC transporter permease [Actinomadura sp. 6K520]